MKKTIASIAVASMMALTLAGCGGGDMNNNNSSSDDTATEETSEGGVPAVEEGTDYETVLNEYTEKLKAETPGLVEQFNAEAGDRAGDKDALATLADEKIFELTKISNEGLQEMAAVMGARGDDNEAYEEWAEKLNSAYLEQAQQITDAYNQVAPSDDAEGGETQDGETQE